MEGAPAVYKDRAATEVTVAIASLRDLRPAAHRSAARENALDRGPDLEAPRSLPRRKAPPLGYFAETPSAASFCNSPAISDLVLTHDEVKRAGRAMPLGNRGGSWLSERLIVPCGETAYIQRAPGKRVTSM